jgi:secreted trypsin-like serine protease
MTTLKRAVARRLTLLGIVVGLVGVGALAASALAVVNGSPDNGRHPYVGIAVWFPTGNPGDGFELCSGSLVSATVFVTAAHCFPEGATVLVDTEESALIDLHQQNFGHAVMGVAHPDPNWRLGAHGLASLDRNDIAVVQLAGSGLPQPGDRYARLPAQGFDDSLPANQPVEIVGYGIQRQTPLTYGTRFDAPAKVIPGGGAVGDEFLKISSSPGQGGATCNGDSGGPDLKAGTDLMLAISSYGASATCKAVAYSQRMDTPEAIRFVGSFLP